jgi:hypothetical protein
MYKQLWAIKLAEHGVLSAVVIGILQEQFSNRLLFLIDE